MEMEWALMKCIGPLEIGSMFSGVFDPLFFLGSTIIRILSSAGFVLQYEDLE